MNTAMSLKMLNTMLSVCDGMLAYDYKFHLVPVTQQLLTLAHQAHATIQPIWKEKSWKWQKQNKRKQRKKQRFSQKTSTEGTRRRTEATGVFRG